MAVRLCPWMDSIPQGARDGGAVMSMDGQYSARSQGWRCGYVEYFYDSAMNRTHPSTTRRETTYTDVGNADIAGANICRPWWLNTRIPAGDGR